MVKEPAFEGYESSKWLINPRSPKFMPCVETNFLQSILPFAK
jgi:hypothetical protein